MKGDRLSQKKIRGKESTQLEKATAKIYGLKLDLSGFQENKCLLGSDLHERRTQRALEKINSNENRYDTHKNSSREKLRNIEMRWKGMRGSQSMDKDIHDYESNRLVQLTQNANGLLGSIMESSTAQKSQLRKRKQSQLLFPSRKLMHLKHSKEQLTSLINSSKTLLEYISKNNHCE